MTAAMPTPDALRGLLYRSRALVTRRELVQSAAVEDFARRNASLGLTGYLHLEDGVFYQMIEGAPEALEQVWTSIRKDPRHEQVTLLSDGPIPARRFGDWSMGFNVAEGESLFDWTARSGLSLKGRGSVDVIVGFLSTISGQPA